MFPPAGDWPRLNESQNAFEAKCVPLWELAARHFEGKQHVIDMSYDDGQRPLLNWANLKVLKLHMNEISVLPWEMWIMTGVEELSYDAQTIKIPTQEIVVQGWTMMRCYMRRWQDARSTLNLDLSHFNLKLTPVELMLASSLTRLDISNNRLSGVLDPMLSSLINLTELNVSNNR